MTGHGSQYDRKKDAAIAALIAHRNVEEAARAIGITKQTLIRWKKLPEFQAAFQEACRNAVSQAHARLQQASPAAASMLCKIMTDQSVPAATRVRAADSVLDRAKQAIETEDIQARLTALEQNRNSGSGSESTE
jgi:hypothetical protein